MKGWNEQRMAVSYAEDEEEGLVIALRICARVFTIRVFFS